MPWLEKEQPDLKALYDKLYPRSYAPKEEQRKLSRLVYRFVRKYGGRAVEPTETRESDKKPKPPTRRARKPMPGAQLDLGM
jgi:hypothetical protein